MKTAVCYRPYISAFHFPMFPEKDTSCQLPNSGTGRQDKSHQRSASESSFASIKTVGDLGFTNRVLAASDRMIIEGPVATSPTANRHGPSDTNQGPVHYADSSNGKPLQERLSGGLRDSYMLKSKAHQSYEKEFLPIGDIERVVSTENVHEVLKQEIENLSEEDLDRLSREICSRSPSRCRVFALLLLGELTKCIRCFIACNIDDTDLPFLKKDPESHEVFSTKDAQKRLKCFRTCRWKRKDLDWLLDHQHAVASPFFDFSPKKLFLYDLPEGTVLPFTQYERVDEGGFATVFRVAIHPDHYNSPVQGVRKSRQKNHPGLAEKGTC